MRLGWAQRSFCWFCRVVSHLLYFDLSPLRQQYRFLLFRGVLFPGGHVYLSLSNKYSLKPIQALKNQRKCLLKPQSLTQVKSSVNVDKQTTRNMKFKCCVD